MYALKTRKRFYRLNLNGSVDLHLSYGEGLKKTYERSKAFHDEFPQLSCQPMFIEKHGERDLFGQEFFQGTPIDESFESGMQTEEQITRILQKIQICMF